MKENDRCAINSARGYDFQLCYFIYMIANHFDKMSHSFVYEGEEDIDVYTNNSISEIIQVKHKTTTPEDLGKDSGLFKVFDNFRNKYDRLCHIKLVRYFIAYDKGYNLVETKDAYKQFILHKKGDIYIILNENSHFNVDRDILKTFCDKLTIEYMPNKSVSDIENDIASIVETSNYFNTKLSTNINIQFKTEYIMSLLHHFVRDKVYNKLPVTISDVNDYIKTKISQDYTEEKLFDEIIEIIKINTNTAVNCFFIRRLIKQVDLVKRYKLLEVSNIDNETQMILRKNIHADSIHKYSELLLKCNEMSNTEMSNISTSISALLRKGKSTKHIHPVLEKYCKNEKVNELLR